MKKSSILLILILGLSFVVTAVSNAEQGSASPKSTIGEIKKAFESPPDMLAATLNKVKTLENKHGENTDAGSSDSASDSDAFKNPFIPKTPEIPKIATPETKTPTPQAVTTRGSIPIPEFTVSGLIWNTRKPAAILNGKIVAIGDVVSSWSISEITKEGVHVKFEKQNLWIKPVVDMSPKVQPNQRNYR